MSWIASVYNFSVVHAINKYGGGVGSIYLDEVECTGKESRLMDCPYTELEFSQNNCLHSKDAGVICAEASIGMFFQYTGKKNVGHFFE